MKYLIILFLLISFNCKAQNYISRDTITKDELIGIWQLGNDSEGDAWPEVYRFFSDGKFIFNLSQYDGLKRILAINGRYRIIKNTIYLNVKSTTEIIGGNIVPTNLSSYDWRIDGGKIKDIMQPKTEEQVIDIKQGQSESKFRCFLFNSQKYYKMDGNPKKYE